MPAETKTAPSRRVRDLVDAMTLGEKIGQLSMLSIGGPPTGPLGAKPSVEAVRRGEAGSVLNLVGRGRVAALQAIATKESRLKIPLLFGLDVVHGYRTQFPVPLAEAAAFDEDLWARTAAAAAREAADAGITLTFAPMLDVGRDPRWGRVVEGPGEDPFVAAAFARAKVRGFQKGDRAFAATAKHFCAYGAVTAGRDYASVDVSGRMLEEVYLPPFKAAVEAGVLAIMPAFVDLAGVPMTAHPLLSRVREDWGFAGVFISDWGAIGELVAHGVAADAAEAAALALSAGLDIDMMSGAFAAGLPAALERGLVSEAMIDAAVLRVLALKEKLGLFDAPAAAPSAGGTMRLARGLAREAAEKSIVLLHDRSGVLPLRPGARIALTGPFATSRADLIGPWCGLGRPADAVSLAEALRRDHDGPVSWDENVAAGAGSAVDLAAGADLVVLCLGEPATLSGEAASRAEPGLSAEDEALARAVLAFGKPTVLILTCGRPLVAPWLIEAVDAALVAWFPGTEGGNALAGILKGRAEASGRLPVSWPRAVGQIPVFFGERPGGRPFHEDDPFTSRYRDVPNEPQFPFGHGGGSTTFALGELTLGDADTGGRYLARVTVSNTGGRPGTAVVFLFIRALGGLPNRPLLDLRGFRRVTIEAGGSAAVEFDIGPEDLRSLGGFEPPLGAGTACEIRIGLDARREHHRVVRLRLPGPDV